MSGSTATQSSLGNTVRGCSESRWPSRYASTPYATVGASSLPIGHSPRPSAC